MAPARVAQRNFGEIDATTDTTVNPEFEKASTSTVTCGLRLGYQFDRQAINEFG